MTYALSQAAPELLETADLLPVHTYPTELLEHLRRFAHGTPEPRVVLLSPGIFNSAYYEHSSLARQMGVPLVRGSDLIVLNSRCFLKTTGGLEPIDVIYRRVDEAFIDPVSFRGDSQLGVPGLMTCVRKGTVTIANAVGTGLGDNRAIAAFLPRLSRFYTREPLLLPTIERRLCFDPDQREMVLADLRRHVVQHVSERTTNAVWDAATMDDAALDALRARIGRTPGQFVAEPRLPLTFLPTAADDGLAPRHAGLRCFVSGGKNPRVFPLALTRHAPEAGSRVAGHLQRARRRHQGHMDFPRRRDRARAGVAATPSRPRDPLRQKVSPAQHACRTGRARRVAHRLFRQLRRDRLDPVPPSQPRRHQRLRRRDEAVQRRARLGPDVRRRGASAPRRTTPRTP